jgi:hypothetical protein
MAESKFLLDANIFIPMEDPKLVPPGAIAQEALAWIERTFEPKELLASGVFVGNPTQSIECIGHGVYEELMGSTRVSFE